MGVLAVENIVKSYGLKKVLDGVDFELKESCIAALVGPNGSGKTTLLNIIAGILSSNSGSISIYDIPNNTDKIYSLFSYMIDNTVLYPYLTGLDHLKFISDVHSLPRKRIEEASEILGIKSFLNKRVREYSLGMKQQLLFTMTLLPDHDLLLLDEPFNGLDPTTIIKVRHILSDLKDNGKTILLSSHNLSEVDQMTSDVLFLKDGKILREDISNYQKSRYEIRVANADTSIQLPEDLFSVKGNMISFEIGKINLQQAIDMINEKFEITDIKKEIIGSEKRYKELFNL